MVKNIGVRTLPYPTPLFHLKPPDPNFILTQFVQFLYAKNISKLHNIFGVFHYVHGRNEEANRKVTRKLTFLYIIYKNKNECYSYKGNSFSLDFQSESEICIKKTWQKEQQGIKHNIFR
jgi:hypothetical protein